MAIIDAELVFSQAQSLIMTVPDTLESTNVYDLSAGAAAPIAGAAQSRNMGVGEDLFIHLIVDTAVVQASTTGTLEIQLVTSAAAALTSPNIHWTSGVFTDGAISGGAALTTVGNHYVWHVGPSGVTWLRYMGFLYIGATQDISAGAITVWIDRQSDTNTHYASGLNFA